ncbi:hypothetical protein MMC22_006125 [Lobaria immixta]|nr:hypothetical protein [Lobaria immixta]
MAQFYNNKNTSAELASRHAAATTPLASKSRFAAAAVSPGVAGQGPLEVGSEMASTGTQTPVRPKRKRVEPDRLMDSMVQDPVYHRYGRAKRPKLSAQDENDPSPSQSEDAGEDDLALGKDGDSEDDDRSSSQDGNTEGETSGTDEPYETSSDDSDEELRIGDLSVESVTVKALKGHYNKLSAREQEEWSPADMNLRALLSLDPDKVYAVEDLNDELTLDRALRLLFAARFVQRNQHLQISPHIAF